MAAIYCPQCGLDHHEGEREEDSRLDREVEIARINAKRDVEVARVTAGMVRDTTEMETEAEVEVATVEAEAGVEAAEAVSDVLEDVVSPEPAAAPEVVVVDAPEQSGGEPEPEGEVEAPPVHEPRRSGYGNSSWFGGR